MWEWFFADFLPFFYPNFERFFAKTWAKKQTYHREIHLEFPRDFHGILPKIADFFTAENISLRFCVKLPKQEAKLFLGRVSFYVDLTQEKLWKIFLKFFTKGY